MIHNNDTPVFCMKNVSLLLSLGAGLGLSVVSASAQVLFQENFDTDVSANWNVNVAGQAEAIFGFDYSTYGVPAAPGGSGTTGLYMRANWSDGAAAGVSVSPIGQSFTGDYTVSFYAWGNFNGPLATGGAGSTVNNGYGIGTAGTTPQWQGGTTDSLFFSTTGDGGGVDYAAYGPTGLLPSASVLAAGSTADGNAYYQGIGGKSAPAAQVALYPGQTGTTGMGTAGMAWRNIEIEKQGDTVTWKMDDLLLATVENYSSLGVGGDNILFNFYDQYNSVASSPMLFALVDNVQVIPEPSTYAAIFGGLALMGAFVYRRRRIRA